MRALLKVDGIKESRRRVDEVGERARKPEPALRSSYVLRALQESEKRKFSRGRFKRDTPEWVARKRREGLSIRTMEATGRLRTSLEQALAPVRRTVYNATLTWGIRAGRTDLYYAAIQASRGRKAVVIDPLARDAIANRVEVFIAHGFLQ